MFDRFAIGFEFGNLLGGENLRVEFDRPVEVGDRHPDGIDRRGKPRLARLAESNGVKEL